MHLGFLFARDEDADFSLLLRLAHAALRSHHEVSVFLMHEGVLFAPRPETARLADAGADIVACGTNAAQHGIALPDGGPVREGSQLDHAALVRSCTPWISIA